MNSHLKKCNPKSCKCYTAPNAISIVAYDPSGATLNPEALERLENRLAQFVNEEKLVLCVARGQDA